MQAGSTAAATNAVSYWGTWLSVPGSNKSVDIHHTPRPHTPPTTTVIGGLKPTPGCLHKGDPVRPGAPGAVLAATGPACRKGAAATAHHASAHHPSTQTLPRATHNTPSENSMRGLQQHHTTMLHHRHCPKKAGSCPRHTHPDTNQWPLVLHHIRQASLGPLWQT